MFNLWLSGGQLDILEGQSIEWNYTPVRFMDDLTDQYSTDFDLPNNIKNTQILQASGLLDSDRRFSNRLEPATLSVNGEVFQVYVQVVSIDFNKISVCVFDKTIPADVLNKKLLDFCKDDSHSIYKWKENSWQQYPSVYKHYNNGLYGKFKNAMYHQSRKLSDVIDIIGISSGYAIPRTDESLWVTATGKNVCPQNTVQVLEVNFTDGETGQIIGGQHVTNDAAWKWTGGEDVVTFNRTCDVKMDIYVSYSRSTLHTGMDHFISIDLNPNRPSTPHQTEIISLPTTQHYNDIVTDSWTVANDFVRDGTELTFKVQGANSFRFISVVVVMTITDYDIIDDDYGIDLDYVYRNPRLRYRNYGDNTERYMEFNGLLWPYFPYYDSEVRMVYCPDVAFSYLGFWCNLPDTTLKELLFGLQWLTEKRFVKENWSYWWKDIDVKYTIDGEITRFDTTNDKLGVANHILFAGEKDSEDNTVSNIDSDWLESNVTVHQSPFAYSNKRNGTWAYFEQYKEPKDDDETGEHSAKYDEIDGLAVSKIVSTTPNLLLRVVLPTLGFDEVTEATTVEIETYNNVKDADFVYLHGRKFMVQGTNTDLKTGMTTVKAVEIWKQTPAGDIVWPPTVEITDITNIQEHTASVTFTISE